MNENELVYQKPVDPEDVYKMFRAGGQPVFTLMLALFDCYAWGKYGQRVLAPAVSLVWLSGVVSAVVMKASRTEVLSRTMGFLTLYCLGTFAMKFVIIQLSGVSGEMIAASLSIAAPSTMGNTMTAWAYNVLLWTSVVTPIGYVVMVFKSLRDFRKTIPVNKQFGRTLGIRRDGTGQGHIL